MCTDTRYYWALTPHIYRYNHHNSGNTTSLSNGVHTVNECKLYGSFLGTTICSLRPSSVLEADAFLEQIRFFTTLILNTDEYAA